MMMKELVQLLRGLSKGTSNFVTHEELGSILWKVVRAIDNEKVDQAIKKLNSD